MRNLKKILALALVFAMAFTFTASAADFTDAASIGASYVDDVNMLVELGVIGGYPDGSFGPQKNITRAEFAKMAYTLKYGSDADGALFGAQKSAFTDVEGNANVAWAKGYINYCANQKIVSGVGNNKFNPQGNITVAEATKMILVILGCDPAKEGFTGANWASNVVAKAIDLGVFDGWSGDPTALATRELVAKLMKNAVFSPVYTYSAITGTGSQLDALGQDYNKTLGEKTMGLRTETGLVVATERYAIDKDAEGKALKNVTAAATGVDSDKTKIYYTYKLENGNEEGGILEIPVALEDTMLGNEVTVFFKADQDGYKYKNVELIGNVMVTNNTVVYDVPAYNVDVFPNGESTSETLVTPYISFIVDGVETQIKADAATTAKVAKKVDFQKDANVLTAFGDLAWVSNETIVGTTATLKNGVDYVTDDFFADMGTAALSNYRFVSVDGGKTYSYIFKMVKDNGNANANVGAVTSYSEAKGSITVGGRRFDLEEVEINGDIATDDLVVYYRENGIVYINKVEEMTGAVEAINDDGSAVIGGETYLLWNNINNSYVSAGDTFATYFPSNVSAMEEGTKYYVYGSIVVDFEAAETTAVVEDYAVILRSTYDEGLDAAYVTLAFADNTQGTYEVSKFNVEDRQNPYDVKNDKAADFNNNAYFGMVVKYKLNDNKVDLSKNDLTYITKRQGDNKVAGKTYDETTYYASSRHGSKITDLTKVSVADGKLATPNGTYTALNDASVIFVLYGQPQYKDVNGGIRRDDKLAPVKAVAYKMVEKDDQPFGVIPEMLLDDTLYNESGSGAYALSYALNTVKGYNKGIVAMAMTVGKEAKNDTADSAKADSIAYVVAANQKYNAATAEYYFQMTLITEDGLFTTKTVDSVTDFSNVAVNIPNGIGKVTGEYAAGTFVQYALDAEGVIKNMSNAMYLTAKNNLAYLQTTDGKRVADGLYLVNAVSERNGSLFFFETGSAVDLTQNVSPNSVKFHEDGYDVITIDDDEYVGESIIKIAARETSLPALKGNAMIQVDEGEIVRVFSFAEPKGI